MDKLERIHVKGIMGSGAYWYFVIYGDLVYFFPHYNLSPRTILLIRILAADSS